MQAPAPRVITGANQEEQPYAVADPPRSFQGLMPLARRPNYNFERREREKAKAAKRAARAEAKRAKAEQRQAGETGEAVNEAPEDPAAGSDET